MPAKRGFDTLLKVTCRHAEPVPRAVDFQSEKGLALVGKSRAPEVEGARSRARPVVNAWRCSGSAYLRRDGRHPRRLPAQQPPRDTHTDQREGETMAGVLTVSCRAVSSNSGTFWRAFMPKVRCRRWLSPTCHSARAALLSRRDQLGNASLHSLASAGPAASSALTAARTVNTSNGSSRAGCTWPIRMVLMSS